MVKHLIFIPSLSINKMRNVFYLCWILSGVGSVFSADFLVEFTSEYRPGEDLRFQSFLKQNHIKSIKKWIPFATQQDKTSKVNFFHVYRITTSYNPSIEINNFIRELHQFPQVLKAEIEPEHRLHYIPNDSSYSDQWYLDRINFNDALDLWDIPLGISPNTENVLLAAVDTGIDWKHPDITPQIWQNLGEDADGDGRTIECDGYLNNNECFGEWIFDPGDLDFIDGDDWDDNPETFIDDLIGWDMPGVSGISGDYNPMPLQNVSGQSDWNHGTHVSGILAAVTDNFTGIASTSYNSRIMMVKIARDNSGPDDVILSEEYAGILYAAKTGFHSGLTTIINISWGTPSTSEFEEELIQLVWENYNAIVVSSAGNGLNGLELFGPSFPAAYDQVISVAPLGQGDVWNHWGNYHSTVNLCAPGESILSTIINNGYGSGTGSSLASPIVAGSIALLAAYHPEYQKEHLIEMITSTADDGIYLLNPEPHLSGNLGKGRLDIYKALATPLFPLIDADIETLQLINDGNGVLNVGDSFYLSFRFSNDENWGAATNVNIQFWSEHPEFTIETNPIFFDSIQPGEYGTSDAENIYIQVPENLSPGLYEFFVSLIANEGTDITSYQQSYSFHLNIITSTLYGDIDSNGTVDVRDLLITREIIIGNIPENGFPIHLVNLNFDDTLNIIDIALLLGMLIQ